jgi:hypothetical protein
MLMSTPKGYLKMHHPQWLGMAQRQERLICEHWCALPCAMARLSSLDCPECSYCERCLVRRGKSETPFFERFKLEQLMHHGGD